MRPSTAVVFALVLSACSSLNPMQPLLTSGEGEVLVSGSVLTIEDSVPVDGGVIIALRSAGGQEMTLYLPSFFRYPPPEQWEWELYEVIRELRTGDSIAVKGPVTENGVRITGIRKL